MTRVLIDYPHKKAGHCGSGALRDLMEWAKLGWGAPPSEGLVFTLGGALDFAYIRDVTLQPPIYLVGRGADMELDLLHRLGAHTDLRQTDDADLGWKWVTTEIDSGRPVMVWADIAELPYLRVRLTMSRHDIVVIGYDASARIAYVIDNDRDAVQTVPYDALARARSSTGFPIPTRPTTYVVDWPTFPPDLLTTAADALQRSAYTLRNGGPGIFAAASPHVVAGTGLAGVRAFSNDLRHWSDSFDTPTLHGALGALAAFIEKAGTGGGLFRYLLCQGCTDLKNHSPDPALQAAAVAAGRAAQAWTAVAVAATTSDRTAQQRATHAAQLAALLPDLEETLANALADAAQSLDARAD